MKLYLLLKKGFFKCLIKIYRPNVSEIFPEGGIFSSYLENLKVKPY